MIYPLLLILHLLCAFIFIGTVFFEVLFLRKISKQITPEIMQPVSKAIGGRAKELIPWVLLILFSTGLSMAWFHREALAHPFLSSFGLLLSIKILLATSILFHFITAMTLRKKGKLQGKVSRFIHTSIFCHMIVLVILAKAMFYIHW
ncbi:membrane protein [Pelistega indica]|uniref:Membrane protein n=1 Tax=Pelistega indica TaxID=1414851 RepID=V8G1U6_9BURK|nr:MULTISPECIES: membrane protein [Pelistega]ETD70415.1 membrane protein [Pelistega indica]